MVWQNNGKNAIHYLMEDGDDNKPTVLKLSWVDDRSWVVKVMATGVEIDLGGRMNFEDAKAGAVESALLELRALQGRLHDHITKLTDHKWGK